MRRRDRESTIGLGVKLITLRGEEKLQDIARVIAESDEAAAVAEAVSAEEGAEPEGPATDEEGGEDAAGSAGE